MASLYGQPAEYCARAMRRLHDGDLHGALEEAGRAIARDEARRDPQAAERLTASAAVLLQRLGRDQLTGAIVMRSAVDRGKEILERQRGRKAPRALW